MKNILGILMISCSILLASCTNGALDPVKVADACRTACNFIPSIDSIQRIIGLGDPIYSSVSAIAKLLCDSFLAAKNEGKLGGELKAGSDVSFNVVVKGQTVPVTGKVQ